MRLFKRSSGAPKAPLPSGADFERLPPNTQEAIMSGMSAPGEDWDTLSGYLERSFLEASPGRQLALLRELKQLTQKQLADAAGIRQADVSAAENNLDDAKLGALRKIADCLGLDLIIRLANRSDQAVADEGIPKEASDSNCHVRDEG
jgi:DNA-binding XRE family transcriptional regulator